MAINAPAHYPGGGVAYRVRKDDFIGVSINSFVTGVSVGGKAVVQYDDGSFDDLILPTTALNVGTNGMYSQNRVDRSGWLVGVFLYASSSSFARNGIYAQAYINRGEDQAAPNVSEIVAADYVQGFQSPVLGNYVNQDYVTATMNVTYTQVNAAGGAVVCEITPGAGNEFIVMAGHILNSGTNGITVSIETVAASGISPALLMSVASAATTQANFGVGLVSTTVTTTASPAGIGYPLIISGTQALKIAQTVAGAQNDTFQVLCNIRVKNGLPTVTHANSTNPANVSVTAGAESFAAV